MYQRALTLVFFALFASSVTASSPDANKALVMQFYNEVILQAGHADLDRYIGDTYIQHNPNLADGKEALRALLQRINPTTDKIAPSGEIVRAVAEGDLVVLHVNHYSWPAKNGGAIVDIFRVQEGMIVEHWDVIQAVPDTSANDNTMF